MAKALILKDSNNMLDSAVKPKEAKCFTLPSRKQAMDFFFATPRLQILYAERAKAGFEEYIKGKTKTYPVHLNTHADIAEFIYNQRSVKIDSVSSVAEKFLDLCIHGSAPKQEKRKREEIEIKRGFEEMQLSKVKRVAKPVPKVKATPKVPEVPQQVKVKEEPKPVVVGKYNIQSREKKPFLRYDVLSAPNFLAFFPNPRVAIFSSKGGLHDVSCALCKEVGHYTSKDSAGVHRKLDQGQKAWIAVLHDLTDREGFIPDGDVSALLAVKRMKDEPRAEETGSGGVAAEDLSPTIKEGGPAWSDLMSEETED